MSTESNDDHSQPDVSVGCEQVEPPSWLDRYREFVETLLVSQRYGHWNISIVLTDNDTIQRYNSAYRGQEYPTDILSFCQAEGIVFPDSGEGRWEAGDLIISLEEVSRNAEEFGSSFEEELRRVTIHGVLHLAGYTHRSNTLEKEPMLQWQEQLVSLTQKEKLF
jgi:probable rRNA maturation factor